MSRKYSAIFYYGVSGLLNRGASLLFFPFIAKAYSIDEFGRWSLILVVANLLIPLLSLNGSAGILREGSDGLQGKILLRNFSLITLGLTALSYLISSFFLDESYSWVRSAILLGGAEALLMLVLTLLRAQLKARIYFYAGLIKFCGVAAIVAFAFFQQFSIDVLVLYSAAWSLIVLLLLLSFYYKAGLVGATSIIGFYDVLFFCVLLIPHGISQWLISGFGRVLLERHAGMEEVGRFSLAFNVASVLMLVNMVLSMVTPTAIIKNYEGWVARNSDERIVRLYTVAVLSLGLFLIFSIGVDRLYFGVIGVYDFSLMLSFAFIYSAMYLMGLYYLYSNYLFYHRMGSRISMITIRAALFSVPLSYLFSFLFGSLGLAVAFMASYVWYLLDIRWAAIAIDKNASFRVWRYIGLYFVVFPFMVFGGVYAFRYL